MKTVIYIDILFLINFIIDFYLLLATKHLANASANSLRIMFGAVIAAISSFMILLPTIPFLIGFAMKILCCILTVLIAFKYISKRQFSAEIFWFLFMNFVFAGVVFFVVDNFSPFGIKQKNMSVYFNVSPFLLIASVLGVYFIMEVISIIFKPPAKRLLIGFTAQVRGETVSAELIYDTGFMMKDPLTARNCILLGREATTNKLPEEITRKINNYFEKGELEEGLHLVPCTTANFTGVLPAIKCEDVIITNHNKKRSERYSVIVFSNKNISDGDYGLVGTELAGSII